jgi:hypothetical protein
MMKNIIQLVRHENLIAGAVFLIALGIYHTTMCPTVSFTDSGELATVATTLGIAHPTGYPLWALIGRLSAMAPFGSQEIVRLNVLAGVLTSLAVAFFLKLVLVLYRSPKVFRLKNQKPRNNNNGIELFGAFVAALTLGFSSTIWSQSVEIEVYALHVLLVIITTTLFVSGIEDQLVNPREISRRLFMFSFVLGLSFANHMTTVLLAPGFLFLYFASLGFNRRSWQLVIALMPFFLIGLTLYVYLPIRSASGTLLDWGHPVTLERLWWHVTGKQYQTWMFSGWNVVSKQLHYFLTNFPTEFHWLVVVFILAGLIETFNQSKRLLAFLALLFGTCLAYSVNFDIHEIDPYFILAYLVCGCLLGIAVKRVVELSRSWKPRSSIVVVTILLLSLPVVQVINNRSDVDQSENYQVRNFVHDAYSQLEPNAVVFSSLWDYFISPSYYYQKVWKERPDVILIDAELLQNRTWYFIQLEREHPGFFSGSREKVDAFLIELTKFEKGEQFEFSIIKDRWDDLLEELAAKSLVYRPVYVDFRIADQFLRNFEGIPQGVFVRLTPRGKEEEWKPIIAGLNQGTFNNYVTSDLKRYVAEMYTFHSYWLLNHKRFPEALESVQEALHADPGYSPALNLKASILGLAR